MADTPANEYTMLPLPTQQHNSSVINDYNIPGQLGGLGRSILLHVLHEMADARDIQHFVCSSRCTHAVVLDKLFTWSIAPSLSESYSLGLVPIELTDGVCFQIYF